MNVSDFFALQLVALISLCVCLPASLAALSSGGQHDKPRLQV